VAKVLAKGGALVARGLVVPWDGPLVVMGEWAVRRLKTLSFDARRRLGDWLLARYQEAGAELLCVWIRRLPELVGDVFVTGDEYQTLYLHPPEPLILNVRDPVQLYALWGTGLVRVVELWGGWLLLVPAAWVEARQVDAPRAGRLVSALEAGDAVVAAGALLSSSFIVFADKWKKAKAYAFRPAPPETVERFLLDFDALMAAANPP